MKAVILAGGLGTRLSEETDRIPKPMIEIGSRPILWHIMKIYSHFGVDHFIICLGYRGYLIKEYFANYFLHMSDVTFDVAAGTMQIDQRHAEPWRVTLVDTGLETQTGGRLKRIAHLVDDGTFCMTYGDGVGDVDINQAIEFHRSHGGLATVTAVTPPGRFGMLDLDGNRVSRFVEKGDNDGTLINGGFFVLDPKVLDLIEGDAMLWEHEPMAKLAEAGKLHAFRHQGFWQPMDTLRDKRYLETLWNEGRAPWKLWA